MPEGDPDGGQWTNGGGGGAIVVAGGFTDEQLGLTVQGFVSAYCQASIYSVLPGQFLAITIQEVAAAARSGDAAARRCLKLLGQDRFRK